MLDSQKRAEERSRLVRREEDGITGYQNFLMSIIISAVFSLVSSMCSTDGIYYRLLLLAAFILIGIVFDIIGVSVTVAEERPFHSMAATAKERLLRDAANPQRRKSQQCV